MGSLVGALRHTSCPVSLRHLATSTNTTSPPPARSVSGWAVSGGETSSCLNLQLCFALITSYLNVNNSDSRTASDSTCVRSSQQRMCVERSACVYVCGVAALLEMWRRFVLGAAACCATWCNAHQVYVLESAARQGWLFLHRT